MNKKMIIGLGIALLVFVVSNIAFVAAETSETKTVPELTTAQKLADFEYMYTTLKENYPFFAINRRVNHIDWLSKKEKYQAD